MSVCLSAQGPFALCRVIKKNEEKTGDVLFHGETTVKPVRGSNSSLQNRNVGSAAAGNESAVNIQDDIPIQASNISNGSNYSTPITSPYQTTTRTTAAAMGECDQFSSMGNNYNNSTASLFVSPDMILDSSKVTLVFVYKLKNLCFFFLSDHRQES